MEEKISKAIHFSKLKDKRGITLIALVITIIILLILAGISIRILTRSNVINKSKEATEKHEIAANLEKLNIEKMNYVTHKSSKLDNNYKVKEFLQFAIDDKVIKKDNVENFDSLDDEVTNTIVQIDKYQYLVEKEEDGNIKITYKGKANPYNGKYITSSWTLYDITKTENIDWKSTFPLDNKPTAIGQLAKNGSYGFKESGNKLIPENQGVHSSSAEAYYPIDLSDCSSTEKYTIKVNATFSSESGCDIGWIAITDSEKVTEYVNSSTIKTDGNILYKVIKSGTVSATDYSYELTGGKPYYLHFGYRKDGSVNSGSDAIIINSIGIKGILKIVQKVPKVTLSTDVNGAKIQYQVGDVPNEEKWIDGNEVLKTTDESGNERYLWYGDYVWGRITNDEYNGPATSLYINDGIEPTVEATISAYSTDSITINVTAKDKEMGMPENPIYCYYIAKEGEDYSKIPNEETTSNSSKFTSLIQNTNYKIKVTTKDKANNEGQVEITQRTSSMPIPSSYITVEAQWSSGEVTGAKISKSYSSVVKDFNMQYQVNNANDSGWKNVNSGDIVTDVAYGDTVYVRLIDNSGNISQASSTTIIDETKPTVELYYNGDSMISSEGGVAAFSYNMYDYESGIDLSSCRWMVSENYIDSKDSFEYNGRTFSSESGMENEIIYSSQYNYSTMIYISILAVDYKGNYTIENLSYTLQSDRVSLKIGDMVTYYPDFGSYTYTRPDGTEGTIKLVDESMSTDVGGWTGYATGEKIDGFSEVYVNKLIIPISISDLTRFNSTSVFELGYINLDEIAQNLFSYSGDTGSTYCLNANEICNNNTSGEGSLTDKTYDLKDSIDFIGEEVYQFYYSISSGRKILTSSTYWNSGDEGYYILENGVLNVYSYSEIEQMNDLYLGIVVWSPFFDSQIKYNSGDGGSYYYGNIPSYILGY